MAEAQFDYDEAVEAMAKQLAQETADAPFTEVKVNMGDIVFTLSTIYQLNYEQVSEHLRNEYTRQCKLLMPNTIFSEEI